MDTSMANTSKSLSAGREPLVRVGIHMGFLELSWKVELQNSSISGTVLDNHGQEFSPATRVCNSQLER
jgi:hypothetical protein